VRLEDNPSFLPEQLTFVMLKEKDFVAVVGVLIAL